MNSLLVTTAARYLLPGMLLFSLFLLFRGHNLPGGGFGGGLVGASAFALYGLALGRSGLEKILVIQPIQMIGLGLVLALCSGLFALLFSQPYLTAQWIEISLDTHFDLKIGTPLIFDIGVYLVVIGVIMAIFLALQED